MSKKNYTAATVLRTPLPRSERLRKLGVGSAGTSQGTVVNVTGGGGTITEGHTHLNKADIDKIFIDNESYINLKQLEETQDGYEYIDKKAKVGYADEAGHAEKANDLDGDSTVFDKVLRKDKEDETEYLVKFLGGLHGGNFSQGSSGAGIYQDEQGNWHIESDYGHFRRKFTAEEVEIQKTSHIGGKLMQTAARMICTRIEEHDTYYRCFYQRNDADGRTIYNQWKVNDQAFVETFNLQKQADGKVGNHFLWRLVMGVSDDNVETTEGYIDLSKSICASESDVPLAGDDIVQLGYQGDNDAGRQTAIIQAGAGNGSPYCRMYKGINGFTLPKPEIDLNPEKTEINAIVHMKAGSDGGENITGMEFGKVNLLRNSGFTGDYNSAKLEEDTLLTDDTELYNQAIKWWAATNATINYEDTESKSGRSVNLNTGILVQSLYYKLYKGERYVLSFKAKGSSVSVNVGGFELTQALTSEYDRYVFKFEASQTDTDISFSGTCTITELQLERGTVLSVWSMSPLDNNSFETKFEALRYLTDAICEGSSSFIGGLGLLSTILVGNYADGEMKKVTGGLSGTYNDDDDVLLWGGGDLEKAIRTVMACKDNPKAFLDMTDEELANYAKIVLTHGGRAILNDVVMRGYIYALGGYFRGTFDAADGTTHFNEDGTGWIGKILDEYFAKWDAAGNGSLCFDAIKWDAAKKSLKVAGQVEAKGGSKIGNLTINENGALSGGNAVFDDIELFSPYIPGLVPENQLVERYKTYIIDRIAKSTTIILGGPKMASQIYTVNLPSNKELSDKSITGGFRLTLISSAVSNIFYPYPETHTTTYRITSRPRGTMVRPGVSGLPEEVEVPTGEIRDNNNNRVDSFDMAQGDVLELYYYSGIYYLLNRRY